MTTISFSRKAFWRRLVVFALVVVFSLASAVLARMAASRSALAEEQLIGLIQHGSVVQVRLTQIQAECEAALLPGGAPDPGKLRPAIVEHSDELADALAELLPILQSTGLGDEAEGVQKELAELRETAVHLNAAGPELRETVGKAAARCKTLANTIIPLLAASQKALRGDMVLSARHTAVADVFFLAALGFGAVGLLMLFSDGVNAWMAPIDLADELRAIEASPAFQSRVRKLCPRPDQATEPWRILNVGVSISHRTHTVFEARAASGDQEVLLWGKAYTWTGLLKGVQRFIAPAYSAATWRALSLMYHNLEHSPFPVHRHPMTRGPFPVGCILLAEHVGETETFKQYVRGDLVLDDKPVRMSMLRGGCAFCNRLHALGIHSFSLRYLHLVRPNAEGDGWRFFLFDLDKVHIARRPNGWWHRFCTRQDDRRLLWFLKGHLSEAEYDACVEMLASAPVDKEAGCSQAPTGTA